MYPKGPPAPPKVPWPSAVTVAQLLEKQYAPLTDRFGSNPPFCGAAAESTVAVNEPATGAGRSCIELRPYIGRIATNEVGSGERCVAVWGARLLLEAQKRVMTARADDIG